MVHCQGIRLCEPVKKFSERKQGVTPGGEESWSVPTQEKSKRLSEETVMKKLQIIGPMWTVLMKPEKDIIVVI